MEKAAAPVADEEEKRTEDPAHRIGQGDGDEADIHGFCDEQVDLAEHHKGTEHDHRRRSGVPDASEGAGVDLIETDGQVER